MFATLSAGAVTGPAVLLSWLVAAVLVIFIALNYAEVMKRVADSGTGLIVQDELEGGDEAEPASKSVGLPWPSHDRAVSGDVRRGTAVELVQIPSGVHQPPQRSPLGRTFTETQRAFTGG